MISQQLARIDAPIEMTPRTILRSYLEKQVLVRAREISRVPRSPRTAEHLTLTYVLPFTTQHEREMCVEGKERSTGGHGPSSR